MTDLNEVLKNRLFSEVVTFEFQKIDGSIRKAIGTLKSEHLPQISNSSREKKPNDQVQVFFDMEKFAWRSFRKDTLIRILD
jgi:hypothetical protein